MLGSQASSIVHVCHILLATESLKDNLDSKEADGGGREGGTTTMSGTGWSYHSQLMTCPYERSRYKARKQMRWADGVGECAWLWASGKHEGLEL